MDFRVFRIDNNFLALLAVILIAVSSVNYILAFSIVSSGKFPTGRASAVGIVSFCAGTPPTITANDSFDIFQYEHFLYDVNATGENTTGVNFTDNTWLFDINLYNGTIDFTGTNYNVGEHEVTIYAVEGVCNSIWETKNITFNISNVNDQPVLESVILNNDTTPGNVTYDFVSPDPKTIPGGVHFWEDTVYNVTLNATEIDIMHGDSLRYFIIWFNATTLEQIGSIFSFVQETGKARFVPRQSDNGNYKAIFHVRDSGNLQDMSDYIDVTFHNVNDAPVLGNKTGLSLQTAESGDPYVIQLNSTDEDGDAPSYAVDVIWCNQTFRTPAEQNCDIYLINSTSGVANFTPLLMEVGNYTLNYTVADGNGGIDWFTGNLTVVEIDNHAPEIQDWYPRDPLLENNETNNVTIEESESQMFNVSVYDRDSGYNMVNTNWYRNGQLVASGVFEYTFSTGYSDSGVYNITIVADDGQLSDWHEWRLVVTDGVPPVQGPSGTTGTTGGSISAGTGECIENWRCTHWSDCSMEGVQIRTCVDINECGTSAQKPNETRTCVYSPSPTCYDGIQNCHGGSCEIMTDCGGPCASCPTCSDGIKNCHLNGQCEERTDCGGPCPPCDEVPDMPVCGNAVCEEGELYECPGDCADFWIDSTIFVVIVILLITVSILLYVYRKETVLLYIYNRVRGE